MTPPVDAVILAGGINRIPLFPGCPAGSKALIPIGGRPLLDYSIAAVRAAAGIGQRIVIGPADVASRARSDGVHAVDLEADSLLASLRAGLEAAATEQVLFLTGDLPLLEGEMVEEFLDRARGLDADVCGSVADYKTMGRYTAWKKPFIRFRDGRFSHGNLFLLPRAVLDHASFWEPLDRLYSRRKRAYRTLAELGPGLLIWFILCVLLFRTATLDQAAAEVSRTLGVRILPVICSHPEVCLDIDEPDDYRMAARFLQPRGSLSFSLPG